MLSTHRALSQESQVFTNKLKQLDLRAIAYQLMYSDEGTRWTLEQTNQAISNYSMFLYLIYLYPHLQLVPSQEIDRVWHHHILDTIKYAEDCEFLFGRFIHHFPYFGKRGKVDRDNLYVACVETQKLFQEHFGAYLAVEEQLSQMTDCQPDVKV
ncbi:MAG: glycine-rich domain-containing protein [Rivularia sp. (in: cyanobacteria)]